MKPTVRRLEQEFAGKVEFQSLDIDSLKNAEAKKKYGFRAQPQFVIVGGDGKVITTRNGMQSYDTLKKDIETLLKS